jgi:P-type Mg2+ transporter
VAELREVLGPVDAAGLSTGDVLARLGSTASGLDEDEARRRLAADGPNELVTRRVSAASLLVRQVRNPLLLLLVVAAVVSGVTGQATNAIIIGVIVALSVGLGYVNEFAAERAMEALRGRITHRATVRRDGAWTDVPVTDLVRGDVVSLTLGALVPADLRILEANDLECDEAVLTGESMPVAKGAEPGGDAEHDLASMGTIVHQGSGTGVVVATGLRTAFGEIAAGLADRPVRTAFEAGLGRFSRFLFIVAALLTVAILAINLALDRPLITAILFALAIAIGITPEMMPAIVTVSLSTGSRALARRGVLVKRLVAIEDLGNVEILFTDKTGTLTLGAVAFERALDARGEPDERVLLDGLVCNEAAMEATGPVGGNALDRALWSGLVPDHVALAARAATTIRRALRPFDHDRQFVSAVVEQGGAARLVVKGSPEAVVARCRAVPPEAVAVLRQLFGAGERVVAVAQRAFGDASTITDDDERDLLLEGFLTFADPPKPEARDALDRLERLGVDVKIITGDNGLVATKVCTDLGLSPVTVLSGPELAAMSDDELADAIPVTNVFARVAPEAKSRIIKLARRTGRDVGFLGDGVNDAVALHHADVGISVDSGSDVAKDAADVVLLEKDLGVLAEGVTEGRRIFANTMKYVLMATSSNFGNMFSAAGASAFLSFLPMLPSQVLLNNLLYNTGQMVIPSDRVDDEALARPAAWDMRFIRRFMIVFGPISSIFDFATFGVMLGVLHAGHVEFRTGWFVESIATQTLVIFVIRTHRVPFFRSRPSRAMMAVPVAMAALGAVVPFTPLAHLLGFAPLPAAFFFALVVMVIVYLVLVESAKVLFYRAPRGALRPTVVTRVQRRERRIARRASRFAAHGRPTPPHPGDLGP